MIDEPRDNGDILNLLTRAADIFALLADGDFAPPPRSGPGARKGGSKDPIFRAFLQHLCFAIHSHQGNVTFTCKTGRPVTGTMAEILVLLRPDLKFIPRELSSRSKIIKSALNEYRLATKGASKTGIIGG
jgi:hypothetical protein